ncbi:hypothetical protein DCCM_2024 [Desulfocucumis palustris]|uniref:Uncharacterized protein n=1 Tax=Desulfocucumis palustris TaxID=1898651 RepID=A0A2L2X9J0_9FIRM|nr:hypothetical protein DCCM_2024 [Desulfocucumis palustris]
MKQACSVAVINWFWLEIAACVLLWGHEKTRNMKIFVV